MTTGMKTVIYPVNDIAAAKRLYGSLLGVAPSMDEVYYIRYEVDGQDIGLDPNGNSKGMTAPSVTGTSTTSARASRRSSRAPRRSNRSATSAAAS